MLRWFADEKEERRAAAGKHVRTSPRAEGDAEAVQRQYLEGWRAWALEIRLRRKEEEEQARREAGEWARKERLQLALELGPKLQGVWAKKAQGKVGAGGGALTAVHVQLLEAVAKRSAGRGAVEVLAAIDASLTF